jgi:hypothetical protein
MTKAAGIIPDEIRDLLERPLLANLATVREDGSPQVNPMWFDGSFFDFRAQVGTNLFGPRSGTAAWCAPCSEPLAAGQSRGSRRMVSGTTSGPTTEPTIFSPFRPRRGR